MTKVYNNHLAELEEVTKTYYIVTIYSTNGFVCPFKIKSRIITTCYSEVKAIIDNNMYSLSEHVDVFKIKGKFPPDTVKENDNSINIDAVIKDICQSERANRKGFTFFQSILAGLVAFATVGFKELKFDTEYTFSRVRFYIRIHGSMYKLFVDYYSNYSNTHRQVNLHTGTQDECIEKYSYVKQEIENWIEYQNKIFL